jgi:hypothetical protein
LSEDNTGFDYVVATAILDDSGQVDLSRPLHYDVVGAAFEFASAGLGGFPIFYDLDSTTIPVHFDPGKVVSGGYPQGLLLLHHHNVGGQRAEVIETRYPLRTYLPLVGVSASLARP